MLPLEQDRLGTDLMTASLGPRAAGSGVCRPLSPLRFALMIRGNTFRTGNALQGETQAEGKRLQSLEKLWSGESSTPTAQNYAPSKLAVCDDRPGLGQLPARLGSLPACRTTARDAEDRSRMCSGLTTTTDDQNHGTCVTMLTCRRIAIRCPRSTEPAEEESLLKKRAC